MFNTQTDLELVKKLRYRCVNAGLLLDRNRNNDPEAILRGCRERERYEYGEILRMHGSLKEHGIEANTSELICKLYSLLEKCANASDEDLRVMVEQTNANRARFNDTHLLALSPWAYLVYVAGRDRL